MNCEAEGKILVALPPPMDKRGQEKTGRRKSLFWKL